MCVEAGGVEVEIVGYEEGREVKGGKWDVKRGVKEVE